jgi:hypothetical protein
MESIMDLAWAFLNSPLGIAMVVSLVGSLVAVIIAKVPIVKKYGGVLISAVKYAEKAIPDDTENSGAQKLDAALKYALKIFAEIGVTVKPKEMPEIIAGLSEAHEKVEADGVLTTVVEE